MRKNYNVEERLLYNAPTLEEFEEARQRELARLNRYGGGSKKLA